MPPHGRVVDALLPVRVEIIALREQGVTVKQIWETAARLGVKSSYTNFVRAVNELLSGPVKPLVEARRRARARRNPPPAGPMAVETTTRSPAPSPVRAGGGENPLLTQQTKTLAQGLRDFRVKQVK